MHWPFLDDNGIVVKDVVTTSMLKPNIDSVTDSVLEYYKDATLFSYSMHVNNTIVRGTFINSEGKHRTFTLTKSEFMNYFNIDSLTWIRLVDKYNEANPMHDGKVSIRSEKRESTPDRLRRIQREKEELETLPLWREEDLVPPLGANPLYYLKMAK